MVSVGGILSEHPWMILIYDGVLPVKVKYIIIIIIVVVIIIIMIIIKIIIIIIIVIMMMMMIIIIIIIIIIIRVIPVVVGALGAVSKQFEAYVEAIGIKMSIEHAQKT